MPDEAVSVRSGAVPRRGPLVIAHRGSSLAEPEHTLKAYRRAIEEGADALECDVRLTADSHLVCVHDRRVNRTSNGRGSVSTLELAELEGMDWGSWKQAHPQELELPDRDRNRLLTLLASEPGRVFTREELVRHLWQSDFLGDRRAIDVHISNLRRKLEPNPRQPRRLVTVRGSGYKLMAV